MKKILSKMGNDVDRLLTVLDLAFCGYCRRFYDVDKRYKRPSSGTPCKPCQNRLFKLNKEGYTKLLKTKKLTIEQRIETEDRLKYIKKVEKL
jgi:hypothetical protein